MNKSKTLQPPIEPLLRSLTAVKWEKWFNILFVLVAPFLVFYNLDLNPRPWHDEGAILSVAKTLVEDGVYATRNFGGYQTFGPIQSAGPTVILPLAAIFKTFGTGLLQARVVAGLFALLGLTAFYLCGRELFGGGAALFSAFLLLGSPAAGFLLFGRHVLGDIPALALFLMGFWAWIKAAKSRQIGFSLLAGCFFGAAILTKTIYLMMVGGTLIILWILDVIYYRQKMLGSILIVSTVSLVMFLAWRAWQISYFGREVFDANSRAFNELARVTTGFGFDTTGQAIQFVFGSGSGYYFDFWGFLALAYVTYLCIRKERQSAAIAFGLIFLSLWLGYFVLWTIPWRPYFIVPGTLSALFVGKLAGDIFSSASGILRSRRFPMDRGEQMLILGSVVAVVTLAGFSAYQFQSIIRMDVLDRIGVYTSDFRKPLEFVDPYEISKYIEENLPADAVLDTWERELGFLTNNTYHYPDQSMLIRSHAAIYRGAAFDYSLGQSYFEKSGVDYVIVGWWGRLTRIYDLAYLEQNANLIAKIGSGEWGYSIYRVP